MRAVLLLVAFTTVAAADVTARFTTTPKGGPYAPTNCVVVWVEDQAGAFVKTIGRWSAVRTPHLVAWRAKAGTADVDAVSGATRIDHAARLTVQWDLKNKSGAIVPDGAYTIRMELTDANATLATQNHEAMFTLTKGATAQVQTGLTNNGFTNVDIDYQPSASSATCGNGVVDSGELCDGAACPSSCAPSEDPCMTNVLVGGASTCDAECTLQLNGTCGDVDISGGCRSSRDPSLLALLAMALVLRRRGRAA